MDTLHTHGNLAEYPHFESSITKFLALQVRHFKSEGPYQVIVQQGGGGSGEVRGHQAWERSSFNTKDKFFFFVSILVKHGWFIGFSFHFDFGEII